MKDIAQILWSKAMHDKHIAWDDDTDAFEFTSPEILHEYVHFYLGGD